MSENHNNDHSGEQETYCAVCHRPGSAAGEMIRLPNGMNICSSCMQDMMNMASRFDFSRMMSDPSVIADFNRQMMEEIRKAQASGQSRTGESDAAGAEQEKDEVSGSAGRAAVSGSGEAAPENGNAVAEHVSDGAADGASETPRGKDGGDGGEDGDSGDKKKDGSGISFFNLGDIFGGMGPMGMGNRPKVKKKKDRPKPVFTIDNLPAPHVVKATLDEYVIGQERAKKALSVAVYNHYKRVTTGHMDDIEIEKSNILMIGPTGSGKTYLVKTLARLLDVPLAIADATSLTEAGYIGDDIESVISKLLDAADGDVERAEKGIVFVDEIDKIAKKTTMTSRDVNGESVQQGMLKLLEGAEVEVPVGASSKNAMVPMATVDTRNILFICGGAFPNLEDRIRQRLTRQSGFGYNAELKDRYDHEKDLLRYVTTEDLRGYGFIPEFIGRLPILCTLQGLDRDMLVKILKEPKNAILKQYQKLLELDEVQLSFEEDALEAIAEKAMERDTGARALRAIIEVFMLDIMYEVPKDEGIGTVTITREYIEGKGAPRIELRTDTAGIAEEQKRLELHRAGALPDIAQSGLGAGETV